MGLGQSLSDYKRMGELEWVGAKPSILYEWVSSNRLGAKPSILFEWVENWKSLRQLL